MKLHKARTFHLLNKTKGQKNTSKEFTPLRLYSMLKRIELLIFTWRRDCPWNHCDIAKGL